MLSDCQILVSEVGRRLAWAACVVFLLSACGQKGLLFLPTETAAQGRATLPETIRPATATPAGSPASAPAATGTASPIGTR